MNRRRFVQKSSLAIVGAILAGGVPPVTRDIRLSFSTLGCPDWPYDKVLAFAAENGYQGIELRGILRELDLTKCPVFSNDEKIAAARKMAADKGLKIVDLGSSAQLHHSDQQQRTANLDEARKYIDLAQKLGCPYVRVFPNELPKDAERGKILDLIGDGLVELGRYAATRNVSVLLESHGDLVRTDELRYVMERGAGPHVGMIWDVYNMWSVTREGPAEVYRKLKDYIRHTHIKNGKMINGTERYVALEEGDAPVAEAVQALERGNYDGFYSFEWEKLWHPEIEEPEVALSRYPGEIRKYFKSK